MTAKDCEQAQVSFLSECAWGYKEQDATDIGRFIASQANSEMGLCGVACVRGVSDRVCEGTLDQYEYSIVCTMMRAKKGSDWENLVRQAIAEDGVKYNYMGVARSCDVYCSMSNGCGGSFGYC